MNLDTLKLVFLNCTIQTIGRCCSVCKTWRTILQDNNFWVELMERDFGKQLIDPNYAHREYKMKQQILNRIFLTAREFAAVANEYGLLWAISGGLCLRYHGLTRMTRDLDIIFWFPHAKETVEEQPSNIDPYANEPPERDFSWVDMRDSSSDKEMEDVSSSDNDSVDSEDEEEKYPRTPHDIFRLHWSEDQSQHWSWELSWWEIETDPILRIKNWIHAGDPFQNPELNLNYANSWAHPEHRIQMDVCKTYIPSNLVVEWSHNNLPYCSLETILDIKQNSRKQRKNIRDKKGYWKDVRDILALTRRNGLDPLDYLNIDEMENPQREQIFGRELHKSFYSALILRDFEMVEEIVFFETPVDKRQSLINDGLHYLKERMYYSDSMAFLKKLKEGIII